MPTLFNNEFLLQIMFMIIPPVDKFHRVSYVLANANRIVIELFGSSNSSRDRGLLEKGDKAL